MWSYAALYLATQDGEHLGWLVITWPILLLPSFLPWLTIALPAALSAGVPHPLGRPLALFAALVWSVEHWPVRTPRDAIGTVSIGTLDPMLFVVAIWLAIGAALLLRRRRIAPV